LEDFEDGENTVKHVELDDLKIKVERDSKPLQRELSLSEFDMNTLDISAIAVDPVTDRILKQYFGNVCPGYLENRCKVQNCTRTHVLPDLEAAHNAFQNSTIVTLKEVTNVVIRFNNLFYNYVAALADGFLRYNNNEFLVLLIKSCNNYARTKECLGFIANTMIKSGMRLRNVIAFIINHHVDSPIARDIILKLIVSSPSDAIYFTDYLERISSNNPIHPKCINAILEGCLATQSPCLPNFLLNVLMQYTPEKMSEMDSDKLERFFQLHQCIEALSLEHNTRLTILSSKLSQMNNLGNRL
jgi:hypothetical protein